MAQLWWWCLLVLSGHIVSSKRAPCSAPRISEASLEANSHQHVIVIGAGYAGLTAALELNRRGFRVTVVDQQPEVGGRAQVLCLESGECNG